MAKYRYAVLTYIFNKYELLHEIKRKDEDVEYICVTDDPELKSETWNVVYAEELNNLSTFNKLYEVRYNPFKYVHADVVLKIDGSIAVTDSVKPLFEEFDKGGYTISLMMHSERNTIRAEYAEWIHSREYPQKQAEKCLAYIQSMGIDPDNYRGLYQVGFQFQRNDEFNNRVNAKTYSALIDISDDPEKLDRLDQPIFSTVFNTIGENVKVLCFGEAIITNSIFFSWNLHNTNTRVPYKNISVPPCLRNVECETCNLGIKRKPIYDAYILPVLHFINHSIVRKVLGLE